MPRTEQSSTLLLQAFQNRLINHAADTLQGIVGEYPRCYLIDYFNFDKMQKGPALGNEGQRLATADVCCGGTETLGYAVLIEVSSGVVEVRNPKYLAAAEKFAAVWEEERKTLVSLLRAEIDGKLGLGYLPRCFEVQDVVTIVKAFAEDAKLTAALPARGDSVEAPRATQHTRAQTKHGKTKS